MNWSVDGSRKFSITAGKLQESSVSCCCCCQGGSLLPSVLLHCLRVSGFRAWREIDESPCRVDGARCGLSCVSYDVCCVGIYVEGSRTATIEDDVLSHCLNDEDDHLTCAVLLIACD